MYDLEAPPKNSREDTVPLAIVENKIDEHTLNVGPRSSVSTRAPLAPRKRPDKGIRKERKHERELPQTKLELRIDLRGLGDPLVNESRVTRRFRLQMGKRKLGVDRTLWIKTRRC